MNPQLAAIEAQRRQAQADAAAKAAQIQAVQKASGEVQAGIAPQVQQTFTDAGNRQATFAKGFSDGLRMVADQSAGDTNAFLSKLGSPQQVESHGAQAGNVAYGLGGYLPAGELNTAGAAFTAAAQQLPGIAALYGQQQVGALNQDTAARQREFDSALLEMVAKRPGLIQDALAGLQKQQGELFDRDLAVKKYNADRSDEKFDRAYKYDALNATQAYRQATLDLRAQGLSIQQAKARTALQAQIAKGARPDAALSKLYGYVVDQNGNAVAGPDGNPIKVKSSSATKTFTPLQLNKLKGDAALIAQDAFNGTTIDSDNPEKGLPPLPFGQALAEMRKGADNGRIPVPIAVRALKDAGYKVPKRYQKYLAPEAGDPGTPLPASTVPSSSDLSKLRVASGVSLRGVNQSLLGQTAALANWLASQGRTLTVSSGYRDSTKQAALYRRYAASGFNRQYIAAKPGTSNHERGEALDLLVDGVPIGHVLDAATLARFGLHTPVAGDYPHTTLIGVNG